MFYDKYDIPRWVEIATLIITGIVFGAMFGWGF